MQGSQDSRCYRCDGQQPQDWYCRPNPKRSELSCDGCGKLSWYRSGKNQNLNIKPEMKLACCNNWSVLIHSETEKRIIVKRGCCSDVNDLAILYGIKNVEYDTSWSSQFKCSNQRDIEGPSGLSRNVTTCCCNESNL